MAGAGLLMLLDDIAAILDDVALMTKVAARKSVAMADDVSVMTKVAAQKTAGVLGDDLALNAQQVTGVRAEREIPVVWAVAKGSLINKAILVPAALLISAFAPWAVTPLLMVGGAFLCFEGCEKLAHKLLHSPRKMPPSASGSRAPTRTRRWISWPWKRTRSRAPCAPTSSSRPRSSPSRWVPWPRPLRAAGRRARGNRRDHDRGRLWPGGRHRQA